MQTFTTLNAIREHKPCTSGWSKLLAFLGKTKADDAPVAMATILESNGISDAIWCLRTLTGKDKEIRLFAVECAEQVKHLLTDKRSLNALEVAKRYANAEATEEELAAARTAAYSAAYAADAAADAAYAAAYAADAVADAVADAAADAAYAADAAADAAYAAAYAADAAYAAARTAAYAAYAADAADAAARTAAYAAAESKQKEIFLKYFG